MNTWMLEAACANIDSIDWFDLDCGLEAAITVCLRCPVRTECLDYAITHTLTDGIWAGYWGESLLNQIRLGQVGGRVEGG
jgi:hypothetical protein